MEQDFAKPTFYPGFLIAFAHAEGSGNKDNTQPTNGLFNQILEGFSGQAYGVNNRLSIQQTQATMKQSSNVVSEEGVIKKEDAHSKHNTLAVEVSAPLLDTSISTATKTQPTTGVLATQSLADSESKEKQYKKLQKELEDLQLKLEKGQRELETLRVQIN